jgi:hypothetical protein
MMRRKGKEQSYYQTDKYLQVFLLEIWQKEKVATTSWMEISLKDVGPKTCTWDFDMVININNNTILIIFHNN